MSTRMLRRPLVKSTTTQHSLVNYFEIASRIEKTQPCRTIRRCPVNTLRLVTFATTSTPRQLRKNGAKNVGLQGGITKEEPKVRSGDHKQSLIEDATNGVLSSSEGKNVMNDAVTKLKGTEDEGVDESEALRRLVEALKLVKQVGEKKGRSATDMVSLANEVGQRDETSKGGHPSSKPTTEDDEAALGELNQFSEREMLLLSMLVVQASASDGVETSEKSQGVPRRGQEKATLMASDGEDTRDMVDVEDQGEEEGKEMESEISWRPGMGVLWPMDYPLPSHPMDTAEVSLSHDTIASSSGEGRVPESGSGISVESYAKLNEEEKMLAQRIYFRAPSPAMLAPPQSIYDMEHIHLTKDNAHSLCLRLIDDIKDEKGVVNMAKGPDAPHYILHGRWETIVAMCTHMRWLLQETIPPLPPSMLGTMFDIPAAVTASNYFISEEADKDLEDAMREAGINPDDIKNASKNTNQSGKEKLKEDRPKPVKTTVKAGSRLHAYLHARYLARLESSLLYRLLICLNDSFIPLYVTSVYLSPPPSPPPASNLPLLHAAAANVRIDPSFALTMARQATPSVAFQMNEDVETLVPVQLRPSTNLLSNSPSASTPQLPLSQSQLSLSSSPSSSSSSSPSKLPYLNELRAESCIESVLVTQTPVPLLDPSLPSSLFTPPHLASPPSALGNTQPHSHSHPSTFSFSRDKLKKSSLLDHPVLHILPLPFFRGILNSETSRLRGVPILDGVLPDVVVKSVDAASEWSLQDVSSVLPVSVEGIGRHQDGQNKGNKKEKDTAKNHRKGMEPHSLTVNVGGEARLAPTHVMPPKFLTRSETAARLAAVVATSLDQLQTAAYPGGNPPMLHGKPLPPVLPLIMSATYGVFPPTRSDYVYVLGTRLKAWMTDRISQAFHDANKGDKSQSSPLSKNSSSLSSQDGTTALAVVPTGTFTTSSALARSSSSSSPSVSSLHASSTTPNRTLRVLDVGVGSGVLTALTIAEWRNAVIDITDPHAQGRRAARAIASAARQMGRAIRQQAIENTTTTDSNAPVEIAIDLTPFRHIKVDPKGNIEFSREAGFSLDPRTPTVEVTAVDINPRAVACARANLAALGMSDYAHVQIADTLGPTHNSVVELERSQSDVEAHIDAENDDDDDGSSLANKYDLILFNPPWLPLRPQHSTSLDAAVFDAGHDSLLTFLSGVKDRLAPQGEAWVVLSTMSELLGLTTRDATIMMLERASGLRIKRITAGPGQQHFASVIRDDIKQKEEARNKRLKEMEAEVGRGKGKFNGKDSDSNANPEMRKGGKPKSKKEIEAEKALEREEQKQREMKQKTERVEVLDISEVLKADPEKLGIKRKELERMREKEEQQKQGRKPLNISGTDLLEANEKVRQMEQVLVFCLTHRDTTD